jgi:hypothetical protein
MTIRNVSPDNAWYESHSIHYPSWHWNADNVNQHHDLAMMVICHHNKQHHLLLLTKLLKSVLIDLIRNKYTNYLLNTYLPKQVEYTFNTLIYNQVCILLFLYFIHNERLVELCGIEPQTSCVQGRRSPSWAIAPILDFFFRLSVFFSLEFLLILRCKHENFSNPGKSLWSIIFYASSVLTTSRRILVGLGGLEPPTSPLSGVRSNHLSYRPNLIHRSKQHC